MLTRRSAGAPGWIVMLLALCVLALAAGCAPKTEQAQKYHCPMHPTYVTDRPGDCPICGMKVVPIPPAEKESMPAQTAGGSKQGESLPGYVTVTGDPASFERAGVRVVAAVPGRLGHAARAVGEVKADETRTRQITLKNSGWIEKLFVNSTGQAVQKGMPLLSIYSPELLASQEEFLQALDAASRFAGSELPEVRQGGEELLRAARRRLELFDVPAAFVAELERTHQTHRTLTLDAPFSGFVTLKGVYEGSRVESGTPLFAVVDLSRVWVEADLYEYEAQAVHLKQPATITPAYDPGTSIPAQVSTIYPVLNTDARTLRVRFDVDNPGLRLKPGMFVQVALTLDEAEGVKVPDSAVMDTGTRQLVFVETAANRFEPRAVIVGPRAGGEALLLSGVAAGEKVVIAANFLLDSESKLQSALAGAGGSDTMTHGSHK